MRSGARVGYRRQGLIVTDQSRSQITAARQDSPEPARSTMYCAALASFSATGTGGSARHVSRSGGGTATTSRLVAPHALKHAGNSRADRSSRALGANLIA